MSDQIEGAIVPKQAEALDLIGIGGEITVDDITSMVGISARREAKLESQVVEKQIEDLRKVFARQNEEFEAACQALAEHRYLGNLRGSIEHLTEMFPRLDAKVTCTGHFDDKDLTVTVDLLLAVPGRSERYYSGSLPEGYSSGIQQTVRMALDEPQRERYNQIRATQAQLAELGKKADELRRFLYDGVRMIEEQFKVRLLGMKLNRAGDSGRAVADLASNFVRMDAVQELLPECLRSRVAVQALPDRSES